MSRHTRMLVDIALVTAILVAALFTMLSWCGLLG